MDPVAATRFDAAAATWDEDPARVRLAADVFQALVARVPLSTNMDALDFGCGTGLLTFALAPRVRSVTAVDSSRGMLDALRAKAAAQGLSCVRPVQLDPDHGAVITGRYDLVVSSMTLHHIRDVSGLLGQFHAVLAPGGWLGLADLDPDGGRFHGDARGVHHHGFERDALRQALRAAGFAGGDDTTAAERIKNGADGVRRRFTVFLAVARKPPIPPP